MRRPKASSLITEKDIQKLIDLSENVANLKLSEFDVSDCLVQDPGEACPVARTKLDLIIPRIGRPIGITLLVNGELVVGDRTKNVVVIYDATGRKKQEVKPERPFQRPSDMVTLPDGRFVVRDDRGLHLFDEDGNYLKNVVPKGGLGLCFGLAVDWRVPGFRNEG